jgi:hypothetical protein
MNCGFGLSSCSKYVQKKGEAAGGKEKKKNFP